LWYLFIAVKKYSMNCMTRSPKMGPFLVRVQSNKLMYYLHARKEIVLMKKRYGGPQIVAKLSQTHSHLKWDSSETPRTNWVY